MKPSSLKELNLEEQKQKDMNINLLKMLGMKVRRTPLKNKQSCEATNTINDKLKNITFKY